jgi:hypothetical protein
LIYIRESKEVATFDVPLQTASLFELNGCKWKLNVCDNWEMSNEGSRYRLTISLTLIEGYAANVSLVASFELDDWCVNNYVLVPGVIYKGNRFPCKYQLYPPILDDKQDLGPDCMPFITDVPRLNCAAGTSRFALLAGSMSIPALGIFFPATKKGTLFHFAPTDRSVQTGIEFTENEKRDKALLRIGSPGVRIGTRYTMCSTSSASLDTGANLCPGDELNLHIVCTDFDCLEVPLLFERMLEERYMIVDEPDLIHHLPFSEAWSILEEKYNRDNWNEIAGYYRVGMGENRFQDLQIGWVGGLMSTLPLIKIGAPISYERAISSLNFFFAGGGVSRSGFFNGVYHKGRWSGDGFDINPPDPRSLNNAERDKYHLLRKSADALYFVLQQMNILISKNHLWTTPTYWAEGCLKCADAFVKLWSKYHQIGQFVNIDTGELIIGGSSSAGILPAALVLASKFFSKETYLNSAVQIGSYLEHSFTDKGLSTGGPGEILQCPDSESAAGLLDSYIALWEATSDQRWLFASEKAAAQLASWQMSYDFPFPSSTEFYRRNIHSAGSVFANSQNNHSAPGICTLSGNSYLKLYRATRKPIYARLLRELSHNLTQYLSTRENPVCDPTGRALPSGWINERVNTSDWDDNLGGVFFGSTWAEVAMMLTCAQIPSAHIRSDSGTIITFDHLIVEHSEADFGRKTIKLSNPTNYPATYSILIESDADINLPLEVSEISNKITYHVPPKSSIIVPY